MSQFPMMPLWCADFFSKTDHLTNEEQWAYLKLMMKTWVRNCQPIPDNDRDIARLLGMGLKDWRRVRPRIEPFFDLSSGAWVQKKLEDEFLAVMRRRENSRSNGSKGGRPHIKHTNGLDNPEVPPGITQTEPYSSSSSSSPALLPNGRKAGEGAPNGAPRARRTRARPPSSKKSPIEKLYEGFYAAEQAALDRTVDRPTDGPLLDRR